MSVKLRAFVVASGLFICALGYPENLEPKYGPFAVPLSKNTNQAYFKRAKAPDFWALIPFYVHQENDSSCSAAALTTVLNGARRSQPLTAHDELVTHRSLTEKYADEKYRAAVSGSTAFALKAGTHLGVRVATLAEVLKGAAAKLKIAGASVTLQEIDPENLVKSKKKFHEDLVKNENGSDDAIILNFTQGMLTGDSEGMIGHIAAVGAYDEKNKLVLILDPDRQWYEPYWSPEDKVFEAVADRRSDAHPGYVYFKYKN